MGNHIAFDKSPPSLNELFCNFKPGDTIDTDSYAHVVYGWNINSNAEGTISEQPLHFERFDSFQNLSSYIILHFSLHSNNGSGVFRSDPDIESNSKNTLESLIASSIETISNDVAESLTISSDNSSKSTNYIYDIYLWYGRSSLPLTKASALALSYKLDRFLSHSSDILDIITKRPKLSSSSIFSTKICNETSPNLYSASWRTLLHKLSIRTESKPSVSKLSFPSLRSTYKPRSNYQQNGNYLTPSPKFFGKRPAPTITIPKIPTPREVWNMPSMENLPADYDYSSWPAAELIRHFDSICSKITDFIYLGGISVAENKKVLESNSITHILNCAGNICPNYFPENFTYKTLYLMDGPSQEISTIFLDVLSYIEDVRVNGGSVYVHCHQGVSRSCSMVICYMMWLNNWNFQQGLENVKNLRYVCSPNAGFMAQLIMWGKKMQEIVSKPRLYRITSHNSDPALLIPKQEENVSLKTLDPRSCFILQASEVLILWIGSKSTEEIRASGRKYRLLLQKYEKAPELFIEMEQGKETEIFWNVFEKGEIVENPTYDADYGGLLPKPQLLFQRSNSRTSNKYVPRDYVSQDTKAKSGELNPEMFSLKRKRDENDDFKFKKVEMFDSEDLDSEKIFLLHVHSPNEEVIVWIGEDFESVNEVEDLDDFAQLIGERFMRTNVKDDVPTKLSLVNQGEEEESFWDYFING